MTIRLTVLNAMPAAEFVETLGGVFEHGPWVAEAVVTGRPFATVRALFAAMRDAVEQASDDTRLTLLRGHPELAGGEARAGRVAVDSATEQHAAGLDRLSDEEFAVFATMNAAYRERFGLPFILCVKRHGLASLFLSFERRLASDVATERATAEREVFHIAAIRLDAMVEGDGALGTTGRISTHVLDTVTGKPAAGVPIELVEIVSPTRTTLVAKTVTNADGRTDSPLVSARPVPIACYELRFGLGEYHRRLNMVGGETLFLDVVPIRFGVADPVAHYHVPLVATPWSYQTYRGS